MNFGPLSKKTASDEKEREAGWGEKWIWTAIDTKTRLLFNAWIGGREMEDAMAMAMGQGLAKTIDGKPLFVNDEPPHYKAVLEAMFHHLEPVPPTGKRGRPRKPLKALDKDLDYATVLKTRKGGRVVKVEKSVVFGTKARITERLKDSPSKTINTSYIERSNLDWRLWDAYLTRKSLIFSKSIELLVAKFNICVANYNFNRPHGTLSFLERKGAVKTTPAMAAGITDRPWTFSDLVGGKGSYQLNLPITIFLAGG
jgi:IS1 family transposase